MPSFPQQIVVKSNPNPEKLISLRKVITLVFSEAQKQVNIYQSKISQLNVIDDILSIRRILTVIKELLDNYPIKIIDQSNSESKSPVKTRQVESLRGSPRRTNSQPRLATPEKRRPSLQQLVKDPIQLEESKSIPILDQKTSLYNSLDSIKSSFDRIEKLISNTDSIDLALQIGSLVKYAQLAIDNRSLQEKEYPIFSDAKKTNLGNASTEEESTKIRTLVSRSITALKNFNYILVQLKNEIENSDDENFLTETTTFLSHLKKMVDSNLEEDSNL